MKKILTAAAILLSLYSQAQEYSLLEINAKWNASNNLPHKELSGLKINFAWLEDQPNSIQRNVISVPTLILMKEGKSVAQWRAGIDLKLKITEKEVIEAIKRANKLGI